MDNDQILAADKSYYNKLTIEDVENVLLDISNSKKPGEYDITKDGYIGDGLYSLGGIAITGKKGWDKINDAILDKFKNNDTDMKNNNLYNNDNLSHRCNFINPTRTIAISSYGEVFKIGASVGHEDKNAQNAVIESFDVDEESNEIIAFTDKGYCHIDFMYNLHSDTGIVLPSEDDEQCSTDVQSTYAIEEIKKERLEQINKHKYCMFHDLQWRKSELVDAAFYCIEPGRFDWPKAFDDKYENKIDAKDLMSRLIIAGSFIAAEIDRLKSVEFVRQEAEREKLETPEEYANRPITPEECYTEANNTAEV